MSDLAFGFALGLVVGAFGAGVLLALLASLIEVSGVDHE